MKQSNQVSTKSDSPIPLNKSTQPQSSSQGFSSLVKRTINEEAKIKVYPHCVIYTPQPTNFTSKFKHHTRRAKIRSFSKRSRFRLFETMAKINSHLENKPFFVSLTYHFGHQSRENSDKTCLHNFLVSLRDFDNSVQYIWRIELQKRGAPHYHLIIFPHCSGKLLSRSAYIQRMDAMWHRIADPTSEVHKEFGCDVRSITNYRQACSYINKYLAKVPEGLDGLEKGKHWGCSRNLPNSPYQTATLSRWNRGRVISKLRQWLLNNGKERYCNDEFFNEDRPQTVFIDAREFYTIMGENLKNMDFSGL